MTSRLKTMTAMLVGAAALIAPIVLETTPLYVWNASDSVPIGLYRLRPADNLFVTELVAVQPPEPLATFLDLNGYLPTGVPMLKRVLALPGQTVCRSGLAVSVDAIEMGEARDRDGRRRPLPKWRAAASSARANSLS
jgi:type IV secretory pathway protease TraF